MFIASEVKATNPVVNLEIDGRVNFLSLNGTVGL